MWVVADGSAAAEACEEVRAGWARVLGCPVIAADIAARRRAVLVSSRAEAGAVVAAEGVAASEVVVAEHGGAVSVAAGENNRASGRHADGSIAVFCDC